MLVWLKENIKYVISGAAVLCLILAYFIVSNFNGLVDLDEENWESVIEEPPNTSVNGVEKPVEEILVDVKGAVQRPGVYKANLGDRVIDLIEKAGGMKENGDAKAVNFAMKVSDEMVLYVPVVGEEGVNSAQENGMSMSPKDEKGKVNLNSASSAELETLPGIGPAKAQAIIEYREENGSFKQVEDLLNISGFGPKTFEKLKDLVSTN